MNKAMWVRLEAMPMDEEIESGHSESQTGLEIAPNTVSEAFEMTNGGEHRKHCLNDHADMPGFGWADFQVFWIGLFGIEPMVCQHNHLVFKGLDQWMKGSVVNVGCGTLPTTHQASLVQQATDLATDDPATIGEPFFSDLLVTATFPAGMKQLHPITIHHTQDGWLR